MTTISDADLVERLPGLLIDGDNRAFYQGWLEQQLVLNRCATCSTWHHPPKPVCPSCWSDQLTATPVNGTGTVHLLVWLHQGPPTDGVDYSTPHPVVTVELDEQPGLRFTSTVIDVQQGELAIGDRVALSWIKRANAPFPAFARVSSR